MLPEDNMVIVIRANTFENKMIRETTLEKMITTIIEAKEQMAADDPSLKPYLPEKMLIIDPYNGSMDEYLGSY